MSTNKKIILTGGHAATTAISVIEELIRRKKKFGWDIYWVGARMAVEGKTVPTLEFEVLPKLGVKFLPIVTGRIQRKFTFWTIPSFLKIPLGFIHALILLLRVRPEIIVSFGGFAAFPVVVVGWFLGIPVVIHDQTATAGRANKASSFFARKIAVARKTSLKYFPSDKTVLIGNPILTQIAEITPKEEKGNPPVILVLGGSRGSQTLNEVLEKCLINLLPRYEIVHVTGHLDYQNFLTIKKNLPVSLSNHYEVYDRIDPLKIDNLYREADMVVARAGANTVSEIIATKRPSILVPIPWSYLNEQKENALLAKDFGVAEIIEQGSLNDQTLIKAIDQVNSNWSNLMLKVRDKKSPDKEASTKMVDLILDILND